MTPLVHQLGELFLRAVPVALIVLIFYLILRSVFFKPILRVMAEREARTIGAQKAAEASQAAAAAKVKQYEEALRHAKAKVYAEQEEQRKKVLDERAAYLKDVRSKMAAEVNRGKENVTGQLEAAKKEIEVNVSQLAAEIARRVLQPATNPVGPARDMQ
jgi:F-type H+-transporting ATPase subunit b